ncbi:MAG: hypothetical protein DRH57_07945, partial [Candidatus Cloacimonadota bacterium]
MKRQNMTSLIAFMLLGILVLLIGVIYADQTGQKDPPNWQPITGTQYNMVLMAQALLNGNTFDNSDDNMIGAFGPGGVDDCRGLGGWNEEPSQNWYFWYFTIVSNIEQGEEISFKLYDTQTDSVYDCYEAIIFENNITIGNPDSLFTLTAGIPPNYGSIQGIVVLDDGYGNVQDVEVTADGATVNPDNDGNYQLMLLPGTYDVTASLDGYFSHTIENVEVITGQVTSGINFILQPNFGTIEGNVSLEGNYANVEDVEITANGQMVNPDNNGFYQIDLFQGNYDVTVSVDGYYPQTIQSVQVVAGQITSGIDFTLYPEPGTIAGIVTLQGNYGNVQDAEINVAGQTLNPDINGYYYIELQPGMYNVSISLEFYESQIIENVSVIPCQTTNVDFSLMPCLTIPDWQVITGTQYSMILMGLAFLYGQEFDNSDYNTIAVFGTGGEDDCHSIGTWIELGQESKRTRVQEVKKTRLQEGKRARVQKPTDKSTTYFWYFTIVGNIEGEELSFKLYDTQTDSVYDCYETIIFENNTTIGSPYEPFIITAGESVELGTIQGTISLNGGSGNMEDVEVNAHWITVHPDSIGNYTINILPGTYDVTASLTNYQSQTIENVEVFENQITADIDFILEPLPGIIEGIVTLTGGSGNVENVEISAGDQTVNPDSNGYYSISLQPGIYDVIAVLENYQTEIVENVEIIEGQTIYNVDFALTPLPGTIEGTVTILTGNGNIQEVELTADGITVNPDSLGNYLIQLSPGIYDVTASLEGYQDTTITNVEVIENQATIGIDFILRQGPPDWQQIGGTQFNMVLMAKVFLNGNTFDDSDDNIIGAFGPGGVDDCRELGEWNEDPLQNWYFWYFTIVSNIEQGEEISFKLYDTQTDSVYDCNETVVFIDNTTIGSPESPFIITVGLMPDTGTIQGTVSLESGSGNVEDVQVSAGWIVTNPDSNGFYSIEIYPGIYDVTASLTNYQSQTIENVEVLENTITDSIDFLLSPLPGAIIGQVFLSGGSGNIENV